MCSKLFVSLVFYFIWVNRYFKTLFCLYSRHLYIKLRLLSISLLSFWKSWARQIISPFLQYASSNVNLLVWLVELIISNDFSIFFILLYDPPVLFNPPPPQKYSASTSEAGELDLDLFILPWIPLISYTVPSRIVDFVCFFNCNWALYFCILVFLLGDRLSARIF
jgi:hypothetical protein